MIAPDPAQHHRYLSCVSCQCLLLLLDFDFTRPPTSTPILSFGTIMSSSFSRAHLIEFDGMDVGMKQMSNNCYTSRAHLEPVTVAGQLVILPDIQYSDHRSVTSLTLLCDKSPLRTRTSIAYGGSEWNCRGVFSSAGPIPRSGHRTYDKRHGNKAE